jgi:PAS domain S-box-containing protein
MALAARIEGDHTRGLVSSLMALMDELQLAVTQLDEDGQIVTSNDTAQGMIGSAGGSEIRRILRDVCCNVGPVTGPTEYTTRLQGSGELRVLLARDAHRSGFVAILERRNAERVKKEVSALRSMLAAAVDSVPFREAAERALRTIVGSMPNISLVLHELDERRRMLMMVAQAGLPPKLASLKVNHPLEANASSISRAAIYGMPVHLPDLVRSTIAQERGMGEGERWTLLSMPVRIGSEVRGVLTVCHPVGQMGERELRVLQGLTDAMGALLARAQADAAVAYEAAARRSLMDNLPDAILEQGADGVITLAGGRVEAILGRPSDTLIGLSITDLLVEGDRQALPKLVESVLTGSPACREFTVLTPQGRKVPCEVSVSATPEGEGHSVVRATFRDITSRRALEAEVVRARDIATQREKLAAIGLLATGVAHEINNPLSYVKCNIEMMASYVEQLTAQVAKIVNLEKSDVGEQSLKGILKEMQDIALESREGVDRIANIVRALKGMARSQGSDKAVFDPGKAIEDAVLIFRGAKKSCTVEMDIGPVPMLRGSPGGLGQVLLNLMDNAMDAMNGAGTIRLQASSIGKKMRLCVSDDGPGIPKEIRERIFEPFFTTKEVGKGTGLGLYICWEAVKQMGGEISFETSPQGTTFTIDLPGSEETLPSMPN